MAASHGKLTSITVATKDISPYTDNSNYSKNAPAHETTGYGVDDETYAGGVRANTFSCSGKYDNTASTGPRNALHGAVGTTVAVVRKVEGTGTGKPQDSFSWVITKYEESSPYNDMVKWSAEGNISGPITTTAQP